MILLALAGLLFEVSEGVPLPDALFFQSLWLAIIVLGYRRSSAFPETFQFEQENQQWAETLFNSTASGLLVISMDGIIQQANPTALRIFRYDDMKGLPLVSLIPGDSREQHLDRMVQLREDTLPDFFGLEHLVTAVRSDGTLITIRLMINRVGQEQALYIANMIEVTEAVATGRALKRWLEMGTDLLVSARWPENVGPSQWQLSFVSPSWEKVLGYTLATFPETPWVDLLHPDEQAGILDIIAKARCNQSFYGQPKVNRFRHKEPNPDGTPRWVHVEWNAVYDPEIKRILISGRDITNRIEANAKIWYHVEELVAANEDLQQFASVAAHQLRSPPRTISGIAQALLEDYGDLLDAEGHQFVQDILTDANNMADVVDGLYRFSKVRNRETLVTEPVDLNEVMRDLTAMKSKTIGFTEQKRFTWESLPTVLGDRVLLTEVFSNLVDNGFKFNESTVKRVHISCTTPQNCKGLESCTLENKQCCCIRVEDNGIGIPPGYRHKLFKMFERLHPDFPGTGVGLFLVQTIVRKIGGEVVVRDNPTGQGTVFCVGLPAPPRTS